MPTIPLNYTLSNVAHDVLNAVKNSASIVYQNYVPYATPGGENLRQIGAILMDAPNLRDEMTQIIGKIALTIVTGRLYRSPLRVFKKGVLDYGEMVEDIFVEMANSYIPDCTKAPVQELGCEPANVKVAYYVVNYDAHYKVTIPRYRWKRAFLSERNLFEFINYIIQSTLTAANFDEKNATLYLLGRAMLDGLIKVKPIPPVTAENSNDIVTEILAESNAFEDMLPDYNIAGVDNFSDKSWQYLILAGRFAAIMNVNTLATAYNMSKVEFMGHTVQIGSFGRINFRRLNAILQNMPNYKPFTEEELQALQEIPAVLCDYNLLQLYDEYFETLQTPVNSQATQNIFTHKTGILALSPFANGIAFVPTTLEVQSVELTPSEANITSGGSLLLEPTVTANPFTPKQVTYTSDNENVTVNADGRVEVGAIATGTTVIITATSVYDPTKSATATLTVVEPTTRAAREAAKAATVRVAKVEDTVNEDELSKYVDVSTIGEE